MSVIVPSTTAGFEHFDALLCKNTYFFHNFNVSVKNIVYRVTPTYVPVIEPRIYTWAIQGLLSIRDVSLASTHLTFIFHISHITQAEEHQNITDTTAA